MFQRQKFLFHGHFQTIHTTRTESCNPGNENKQNLQLTITSVSFDSGLARGNLEVSSGSSGKLKTISMSFVLLCVKAPNKVVLVSLIC